MKRVKLSGAVCIGLLAMPAAAQERHAAVPMSANEVALQAEVTALKAQLAAQAARLERLEAKSEGLAQAQDSTAKAIAAMPVAAQPPGPVATPQVELAKAESDTTIGGYGELNYNG